MSPPPTGLDPAIAARLRRDDAGLVAAVVQQHGTGEVLMLGWMDDEALHRTLTTGRTTFWSRSRQQYWRKGDTSGNVQTVREVRLDCDGDALLVTVESAANRQESRGAHVNEDFPERDDANWMKHTLMTFTGWGGKEGTTTVDYRPVHDYTLTDDIEYIKPKKRVY